MLDFGYSLVRLLTVALLFLTRLNPVQEIVGDKSHWFGTRWCDLGTLSMHAPTGKGPSVDQQYLDAMDELQVQTHDGRTS
eukprot:9381932-Lingulodinium_polyedra.AAC.1